MAHKYIRDANLDKELHTPIHMGGGGLYDDKPVCQYCEQIIDDDDLIVVNHKEAHLSCHEFEMREG